MSLICQPTSEDIKQHNSMQQPSVSVLTSELASREVAILYDRLVIASYGPHQSVLKLAQGDDVREGERRLILLLLLLAK